MTIIKLPNNKFWKNKFFFFGILFGAVIVTCITLPIILVQNVHTTTSHTSEWSYLRQDLWDGLCQTGQKQSPINLIETVVDDIYTTLPSIHLENINYFETVEVGNTGHTVTLNLTKNNSTQPRLYGGGLSGNFTLNHAHFHWPSEHSINGKSFDLEAHLVFYSDLFQSLSDALEVPNQVTVLAILFEQSNNESSKTHTNFQTIDKAVLKVSFYAGSTAETSKGLTLEDFFPNDLESFFAYSGSLTTPSCNEGVNWIILREPVEIYENDLDYLTNVFTEEQELLEKNNRDLQEVNGRTIVVH